MKEQINAGRLQTNAWSRPALPGQDCIPLPAVPAATTTTGSDGTHGKSEQPDSQHDHGDDPQGLQCESGTEEKQGEQENEKQGNHSYQPPEQRVP